MRLIRKIIRTFLLDPFSQYMYARRLKKEVSLKRQGTRLAFIIATPEHGNLGDQAIVICERNILEENGFRNRIVEITNSEYYKYSKQISKYINHNDLIVIDGGGNLGTLWPWEDDKITNIIDEYADNSILIFPQTCFYSNDELGKTRLVRNVRVYQKAKDLTITLRDKASFDFCKANFPSNVSLYLVPDIVLSMSLFVQDEKRKQRNGVLLCFRNDRERVVTPSMVTSLSQLLSGLDLPLSETSTLVDGYVGSINRELLLKEKLKEFESKELVITDRLHAMIFAYITNTPCIAFDNLSNKISGVYDAVGGLQNILISKNSNITEEQIRKYLFKGGVKNKFDYLLFHNLISKIAK